MWQMSHVYMHGVKGTQKKDGRFDLPSQIVL